MKGFIGASGGEYADLRDGVSVVMENIYFFNFQESSDFEIDEAEGAQNYLDGATQLINLEINTSHLTDGNRTIAEIFADKSGQDVFGTIAPGASIVTSPTVGADKTAFANWTWADVDGQLSDF